MPPASVLDVSIVVPCHLRSDAQAALLDETLESVDAQRGVAYEVVVVDDGSPLDVGAVTMRHPRTRRVWRPNGGSAQARNTGIAASRGRMLVFLDAHDQLLPGALEGALERLDADAGVGFVVGPREEMTAGGDTVPWAVASPPVTDDLYRTLLALDWSLVPPSAAMIRREVVDGVHGFRDPWGADDLDFFLRVTRRVAGACYDGAPVTRWRRDAGGGSRDGVRMLRSVRIVYERQRPHVHGHPAREAALAVGLARLEALFRDCLAENVRDGLRAHEWRRAARAAALLAREDPRRCAADAARAARALRATLAGRRGTAPA